MALISGGAGDDVLVGTSGSDSLDGGAGNDSLSGGAGLDALRGGTGDDVLDGGTGGERLPSLIVDQNNLTAEIAVNGGDLADYGDATVGVTVNLTLTGPQNTGWGMDTLVNIEDINGGSGADILTGNDLANMLLGGGGDDQLNGGGGDDVLVGSLGNDLIHGGDGNDIIRGGSISLGYDADGGVDHLYGDGGDDIIRGSAGHDWLYGGDGNDTLQGMHGADYYSGGAGNDSIAADFGDLEVDGGDGNDVIELSPVPIGEAQQLALAAGGAGDDVFLVTDISTLTKALVIDGGGGFDILSFELPLYFNGPIVLNLAAGANAPGLHLTGIETITSFLLNLDFVGSAAAETVRTGDPADRLNGGGGDDILSSAGGDDLLFGGDGADQLLAGWGNDHLNGGEGADYLDGGAGFDLVRYDDATSGVAVNLFAGVGGGGAAGDVYVAIEGVVGSAFADVITGDNGDNVLYGLVGDDILHGGAGDDQLLGGGGNDHLYGGLGADLIDGGAGFDLARFDDSATTGVVVDLQNGVTATGDRLISIEGFVATNWEDNLYGDGGSNLIYALGGDDRLVGGAGDDQLFGGDGNDHLYGGLGADLIDGGAGFDLARFDDETAGVIVDLQSGVTATGDRLISIEGVVATNRDDRLYGDAGANVIYGLAGDDRIVGGAGDDLLYGGSGADVFAFDARSGVDQIRDFEFLGAGHDVIAIQKNVNGSSIVDFATLMAHAHDGQTGLTLDLGGGNEVQLVGVTIAELNAGHFLFY
ncbi:MAG: hypothetical protein J7515_18975 [Caulobacter sp.]|nr:hypothetical protein [Caulobacter sp.]